MMDSSLLREARDGNECALSDLVETFAPKLLALVRVRLGRQWRPRIESQDIVQMVLVKACTRIEQFDGSGGTTLFSWLAIIAQNEIRDQIEFHQRHRRDRRIEVLLDTGLQRQLYASVSSMVGKLHLNEQQLRLEVALETLSGDQRTVIEMRNYEDLSFVEIGERMEKSPDACRMLQARAMKALTEIMAAQE